MDGFGFTPGGLGQAARSTAGGRRQSRLDTEAVQRLGLLLDVVKIPPEKD